MDTAARFINRVLQNRPALPSLGPKNAKDKSSKEKKKKNKSKLPVKAPMQAAGDKGSQGAEVEGATKGETKEEEKPQGKGDKPAEDVNDGKTENGVVDGNLYSVWVPLYNLFLCIV